jgi:hypothetical protein
VDLLVTLETIESQEKCTMIKAYLEDLVLRKPVPQDIDKFAAGYHEYVCIDVIWTLLTFFGLLKLSSNASSAFNG